MFLDYFKLSSTERKTVARAKFDFYKRYLIYMTIFLALSSITYIISDCLIYKRVAYECIIPRFSVLFVLGIYLYVIKHTNNYKIASIASHLVCHSAMWGTIWAIVYLPDKSHCSEGFLIFEMVILVIGFGTPLELSIISQLMVIGNILISNLFMHYKNFSLLIALGLPVCLGMVFLHILLNHTFYIKYLSDKKLESISYTDQLTGAYNRHKLNEFLEGYSGNKESLSFILCDIDFFKKINDNFGHDMGDEVLKLIAGILKNYLVRDNILVRWGGEEFLMVLNNFTEAEAYDLAERLRVAIQTNKESIIPVTMSFGVANFNVEYGETIKNVDKALYRAKETGRNKVVKYSSLKNRG